ncbi:MAG TPA: peptide chain release factor N(5)-glutamine methyltransferase [Bacteroidales bacterium]|nr:peptide chain release factor N(5)-glutamine methyltransferase [Bacteroidales bacterium]
MTYKQAFANFHEELKNSYPETEIEAFIQIICRHLFGLSRFDCMLRNTESLSEKSESQIYNIIQELKRFKPLQYILGETEFYGLRFFVNGAVLIPRPETEELVEWIISDCKGKDNLSIIDIGTGSGCIPVSLAKFLQGAKVSAIDISEEALVVAKKNAEENKVNVQFIHADILKQTLPKKLRFDVIVSNPPYVTADQKNVMNANVLDYEPHIALFAPDQNPFVFYEAIAAVAQDHLKPEGSLYFEINEAFPHETADCIRKYGFGTELKQDINGKYRMIKAKCL